MRGETPHLEKKGGLGSARRGGVFVEEPPLFSGLSEVCLRGLKWIKRGFVEKRWGFVFETSVHVALVSPTLIV